MNVLEARKHDAERNGEGERKRRKKKKKKEGKKKRLQTKKETSRGREGARRNEIKRDVTAGM